MPINSMPKIFAVLCALAIIFSMNFAAAAKKRVAVMPLENVSGSNEERVAEIMSQQLVTAIHSSGSYTVVERSQIDTVLREQGFQNLTADPSKAVETGELSGAEYTLLGKVTMVDFVSNPFGELISKFSDKIAHKVRCKITLDFRMVDNASGEIAIASTVEGSKSGATNEEALNLACKEVAENFLKELDAINPFRARIADISGSDIYIDKGSESGLRRGEILIVSREVSPITVNGKIVGMKQKEVGKVKVVEVGLDYSVCRAEGFLNDIRKGDVLKRS